KLTEIDFRNLFDIKVGKKTQGYNNSKYKEVGYNYTEEIIKFIEASDIQITNKKIPFQIVTDAKGKDLVGIKYEQLIPVALPYQNPENAFRVISGDFVTTEDGTGIVHTAPTFGADDAKVAKEATPEVPPMLLQKFDLNTDDINSIVQVFPIVDLQGR